MSREQLLTALRPVLQTVAALDLKDEGAAQALGSRYPADGEVLSQLRNLVRQGVKEGWLADREAGGVRFSRLAKAGPDTFGLSIDVVHMNAPGPGHTHPNGEVDLCFPVEGQPTFDGRSAAWTVYPQGSWHVPSVQDGVMDILYFLPEGAISFEDKP